MQVGQRNSSEGSEEMNRRTGKKLIGWRKHREQGRANETDAGQVWREEQAGSTEGKKQLKTQHTHEYNLNTQVTLNKHSK